MIEEFLKEEFMKYRSSTSRYSSYELIGSRYILYIWDDGDQYWTLRGSGFKSTFSEVFSVMSEDIQKRLIYYLDLF